VRARQCLGRIEKVTFTGGEGGGTMTVSGRMAESLLADRIISRGTVVSGPLCAAVEAVVAANAAEEAGERAIPCLVVRASEPFVGTDGLPLTVEDRVNGRQLDEWLYETLGSCGASYRIVPDHDAGVLVFSVYRGLDRTQAQEENSFAVFSASFSSAGEFDFLSDNTDCRNFAWIAGEGEGDARVMVTLDLRQDEREPRRELYVDARDLRSSDGEEQMSEETYRNLLLARGRQRLAQHAAVMRVSGSAAGVPPPLSTAAPTSQPRKVTGVGQSRQTASPPFSFAAASACAGSSSALAGAMCRSSESWSQNGVSYTVQP